jgi:septum formation protein
MAPPYGQLDTIRPRRKSARVLVLASASPRRHQLLGWLGVDYVVDPPDVDERREPAEPVDRMVARLASAKAAWVAARWTGAWVLGADTVVELAGDVLGKPANASDATRMLTRLAGREHRVFTGFTLRGPGVARPSDGVVVTRVRFRAIPPASIAAYVASGEPEGKAGGYAIQGRAAVFVASISGSYSNVVGLPLYETYALLSGMGCRR